MPVSSSKRDKLLGYRGQFLVRLLGTLLLTASAVMVVLGLTVWSDRLAGVRYITYWSWCFVITFTALLVALIDLFFIRRAGRKSLRQLLVEQFLSEDFLRKLRSKKDRRD